MTARLRIFICLVAVATAPTESVAQQTGRSSDLSSVRFPPNASRTSDYWSRVSERDAHSNVAPTTARHTTSGQRNSQTRDVGGTLYWNGLYSNRADSSGQYANRSNAAQTHSDRVELNPTGASVRESDSPTKRSGYVDAKQRYNISPRMALRRFDKYRRTQHTGSASNAADRPTTSRSYWTVNRAPNDNAAVDRAADTDGDVDPFANATGGSDLLSGTPIAPRSDLATSDRDEESADASDGASSDEEQRQLDPHWEVFSKSMYPSAKECATCHEKIYREWSVSSHAYAAISPMFHKFEQTINDLSQGTIGYFCMRCHAPVATDVGIPRDANLWDAFPAAREGVTCIACHRVVHRYGRVNGQRRIELGSLTSPVVGAGDGAHLNEVLARKDHYKIKLSEEEKGPGQVIHNGMIQFDHVAKSDFCVSCHQVAVFPGISLEVVWAQYRASPACKSGIRCQDCHMGAVPGKAEGFEYAPSAVVNGKEINPHRRHSNHMFVGPGYSIAHPGTFPFHKDADRWSHRDWLLFDWRAGWGTEDFEESLSEEESESPARFPEVWRNVDDRYDAREIIEDNQELLAIKKAQRFLLMENNSKVQGPFFKHPPRTNKPLDFYYLVQNLSAGHNMPSGSLGAQPQLWLNTVLTGPSGEWLWESGYVDVNGDMADLHSLEVAAGRIKPDTQLVNFQTKFLITHVKGPDREMYLPINVDFDQLPFIRPSGFPITTMNHPPFIRMEAHSLPPLGKRKAKYRVPKNVMCVPGRYRLSVRMRSRAEPIYFMRFCESTPEMERSMNEEMLNFHQHTFEFIVR